MDGVTILAAGLVGAGAAVIGVTQAAMGRRKSRNGGRRGTRPGQAIPTARAGQLPSGQRAAGARVPGARSASAPPASRGADARSRAPGVPAPAGYRPAVEALGGETLQLGPVPAWRVPVGSRPGRSAPRGSLFGRRRGQYTSEAAVVEDEAPAWPDSGAARTDGGVPPVVANNASRRHDPRTAPGRRPGR
jgi:hypothetical protein